MYSKRMAKCTVSYLTDWKEAIKEWKDHKAWPVSKTTGMKDFVAALCDGDTYWVTYPDIHDRIMDDSTLMDNGYLKPNGYYHSDPYIISDDWITTYQAMMDAYDKYLCTDGVIRYRPTPEANAKYQILYEQAERDFWDSINAAFESMGMFYNEDEGVWINPETGEVGCY